MQCAAQIQQGVKDFALDLPGALRHAGHPQPLVHGLGGHDVVAGIGVNPPLGQGSADDGADPSQEGENEAQSCSPALAMARSAARAGSGVAGAEGGEFAGAQRGIPKVAGPRGGS